MDNYKILNTKTNAIIKLLNELGYAWVPTTNDSEASLLKAHWILAESSGDIAYSSTETFYVQDSYKELSFNQLNDVVVLKRNDVKDATHEDQYGDKWLYLDERHYVYLNDQWVLPIGVFLERYELKPLLPTQTQDQGLISGAEALRALADGKEVEYWEKYEKTEQPCEPEWCDMLNTVDWDIKNDVLSNKTKFRLKPQTIKLDIEIPAPFEPKEGDTFYYLNDGEECGYVKCEHDWTFDPKDLNFGAYRTEGDVKKAVEQLRKIRGAP